MADCTLSGQPELLEQHDFLMYMVWQQLLLVVCGIIWRGGHLDQHCLAFCRVPVYM